MNVFAWVWRLQQELRHDGDADLAGQISELPTLVCNGDHAQADAMVPTMLEAARARQLPWLEVFVRHWHLQSRVAKRGEGKSALTDAVEAVDRAHRPDTRSCPQAVCAVQDLCMAYANVDGPGYAAERLAVTEEALQAIDSSWPCFACLSSERAAALTDAGRPAESVEFLARQRALLLPDRRPEDRFRRVLTDAELALGRPRQALRAVRAAEGRPEPTLGTTEAVRRRLDRAVALAACGRHRAAAEALPPAADIPERDRPRYGETAAALVHAGAVADDGTLSSLLSAWAAERLESGACEGALRLAAVSTRLAAARGDRAGAGAAVPTARLAAAGLRYPASASDLLAELSAVVEA